MQKSGLSQLYKTSYTKPVIQKPATNQLYKTRFKPVIQNQFKTN